MQRLLGVGACQMKTDKHSIKKNLDTLAYHIKTMMEMNPWVKIICLNELCFQGSVYSKNTAQEIPGEITAYCADIAKLYQIYLIPGSMFESSGATFYNTSVIFDPAGDIISTYRKMFPWKPFEKSTPGTETCVFEIPGIGRIGICICYDLWFPELVRDLVWKGAEIIFIPTLTGSQDRMQEIILARAAAITNQCFIISINGALPCGKGESLIVDPEGYVTQLAGQQEEYLFSMLDLNRVQQVRKFGTAGVSRPMTSFFTEKHRFDYQYKSDDQSPVEGPLKTFALI